MFTESTLTVLLTNFVIRSPIYLVIIVAGIVTLTKFSQHRKPATFVLLGLILLLASSLVSNLVFAFLPGLMRGAQPAVTVQQMMVVVNVLCYAANALGIGLLVRAAFVDRVRAE